MIQTIEAWEPYAPFLQQIAAEAPGIGGEAKLFSKLAEAFGKENSLAFGAFDGAQMTGLFAFDPLEERYFVTSCWLTRSEEAGREMLAHLKAAYPGYGVEVAFRPENTILRQLLEEVGAAVFPVQQNMERRGPVPAVDTLGTEPLSKEHESRYFALHRDSDPDGETYWTGEMVAADPSSFLVLLALEHGVPVGYLDLAIGNEGNNVSDLFVDRSHRRKGWGRKLLARAIEYTGPKPLTLQVDEDNAAAIGLYESMGFRLMADGSWVDAIWRIGE